MDKISRLTKESEERLSAAIAAVRERTTHGECPNDAIVKVASDKGISAGHVRLLVRAYNNGRAVEHIKSASSLVDKASAFPLADASVILERMFPTDVKTPAEKIAAAAVSDDYKRSPSGWLQRRELATRKTTLTKAAAERKPSTVPSYPEYPHRAERQALSDLADLERELSDIRQTVYGDCYKVASAINAVGDYFRRPDAHNVNEVRVNAAARYGPPGEALLTHATKFVKAAQAAPRGHTHAVNWDAEPYALIKAAMDSMSAFSSNREKLEKAETEFPEKKAALLRPFGLTPQRTVNAGSIWEDRLLKDGASVAPFMVAGVTSGMARGLAEKVMPKTREMLVQDALQRLGSPKHEDRLREIQAQTMLHELIASDPVISGYDPEDVMEAYNNLAEVQPRAMQTRLMAQALLRKYLEQASAFDPFDVDQMLDVEKKITARNAPEELSKRQALGPARELGIRGQTEAPGGTNQFDQLLESLPENKPVATTALTDAGGAAKSIWTGIAQQSE
jgi:hypothetical protein